MGVYQLARMPVLLRMVEGLWLQCGPLMRALDRFPMAKPRKQHPHLAVLRGLRRAEPEAARQGILEELERTTQPILTYLKAQGNVAEAAPARRERKTRDEVL